MTQAMEERNVPAGAIEAAVAATFAAAGGADAVAPTIANGLVEANLSAHDSHGVGVAARERARDGIPLPARTRDALAACARALGVAHFDEAFARR